MAVLWKTWRNLDWFGRLVVVVNLSVGVWCIVVALS